MKSAPEVPGGPSQTLPLFTQLAVRHPVPRAEVRRPGFPLLPEGGDNSQGVNPGSRRGASGPRGGDCGTWRTAARGFSKQGSFLLPESAASSRTHFRAERAATAPTPRLRWKAAWNSAMPSQRVEAPFARSRHSAAFRLPGFPKWRQKLRIYNTVSSLQPLPELLLATC